MRFGTPDKDLLTFRLHFINQQNYREYFMPENSLHILNSDWLSTVRALGVAMMETRVLEWYPRPCVEGPHYLDKWYCKPNIKLAAMELNETKYLPASSIHFDISITASMIWNIILFDFKIRGFLSRVIAQSSKDYWSFKKTNKFNKIIVFITNWVLIQLTMKKMTCPVSLRDHLVHLSSTISHSFEVLFKYLLYFHHGY